MIRLLFFVVCLFWSCSEAVCAAEGLERPNVVLLLVDDLGYAELGCQGNTDVPTPHIDSIAANGVRFTDGYVTAPFCSASRAGLMTGRFQSRFGYDFNPIGQYNDDPRVGLPQSEATLAERLRDAGYATGLVGKWHLGGTAAYHPLRRGFDEFYGFLHEGHFYVPPPWPGVTSMLRRRTLPNGGQGRWTSADGRLVLGTHLPTNEPPYDANNPILRGGQPVVEEQYLTDAFTREAVDFIGRHRERPFFLYVAYNAVHSPLQGADASMSRFSHIEDVHRRIFAAMLSNLDDGVRAVLQALRDEGIEQRTLVVFLSDNGGPTRELTSSNAPLRGEKGDLYEGGIRVPFLAQWPGTLPAGHVERRPVVSLDIHATALAMANCPAPRPPLDGVNLLPYLTGKNSGTPHQSLYWRVGRKAALRAGDWKLVRNPGRNPRNASDAWQLYNLAEDVGETQDLAAKHPEKLKQLTTAWEQLDGQMQEPFWSPGE
jgi:arylsulfatase A-like enzyme